MINVHSSPPINMKNLPQKLKECLFLYTWANHNCQPIHNNQFTLKVFLLVTLSLQYLLHINRFHNIILHPNFGIKVCFLLCGGDALKWAYLSYLSYFSQMSFTMLDYNASSKIYQTSHFTPIIGHAFKGTWLLCQNISR